MHSLERVQSYHKYRQERGIDDTKNDNEEDEIEVEEEKVGDEKVFIKIWFLDNTYKMFLVNKDTETSENLVKLVCEKLGFTNIERDKSWFGFFESNDGSTFNRLLLDNEYPGKLIQQNSTKKTEGKNNEAKSPKTKTSSTKKSKNVQNTEDNIKAKDSNYRLVFMIRVQVDELKKSECPVVQHLRFLQAVYYIAKGDYPLKDETFFVQLAALQYRSFFPNETSYQPGFLLNTLGAFFPRTVLMGARRLDYWEHQLDIYLNQKNEFSSGEETECTNVYDLTPEEAEAKYLEINESLPLCGALFYECNQENFPSHPQRARLGICEKGVSILPTDSVDPYHLYPFKDVLQWGYVNEYTFYIIMKDNPAKKHVFGTNSGSGICDALSIYVRGIMKQMEIQNENANTKTNSPSSRVTNVDTINGG